jgi:outer membrane protein TolC
LIDAPPPPAETLDALAKEALEKRRDLEAMNRRVLAAGEMVRIARGGGLPEVGVTGQYEANAQTFIGADGTNWSIFLAARLPLYAGGATRARAARAMEEQRAAEQMNELMRDGAGLEVRQAWYDGEAARRGLELATASVAQARAALSIVEDRYKEGLTNIVELMSAQTALTAARTREVSARREVLLNKAALDLAVGRL